MVCQESVLKRDRTLIHFMDEWRIRMKRMWRWWDRLMESNWQVKVRFLIQIGVLCGVACAGTPSLLARQVVPANLSSETVQRSQVAPVNHIGKGHVDLEFCRVKIIQEVEVPAQESGPLVALPVSEGQAVQQGQDLAQLDDRLARLRLETAQTKLEAMTEKASNNIDVRAATNALQIAERERKRNYQLFTKGSMPRAEYDRSALQAKQAALQLEQAERDMQAAGKDAQIETYNVKAASDSILRHQVKSPINGVVMELHKRPGEWVNAGDNVMRVAQMDRLYVQGLLDSSLFNPHEIEGQKVTISVPVARGESLEFRGRIIFVAMEKYNAKSYVVKAEVENRQHQGRWLLMANEDEALMRIHLGDEFASRVSSTPDTNPKQ